MTSLKPFRACLLAASFFCAPAVHACAIVSPAEIPALRAKAKAAAQGELEALYARADRVFMGNLIKIDVEDDSEKMEVDTYTFRIIERYKGDVGTTVTTQSRKPQGSSQVKISCDTPVSFMPYYFSVRDQNNVYLIYTEGEAMTRVRMVGYGEHLSVDEELRVLR